VGDPGAEDTAEVRATDAARRKAEEMGVDLSRIEGSGVGGRVVVSDVNQAAR
jgi:pyruvate/2-oxoglutarate dehydrogenase complex dihydrolipoamide acyltransferase (E2) component